jgi:hypothetical protein
MTCLTSTKKTTICSEWPADEAAQILGFGVDAARNRINQRSGEVSD